MDAGAWIVIVASAVAVGAAFGLRRALPPVVTFVVLAVAGAALGWGGMLTQPDPSTAEAAAAVVLLAILVPVHVRIVLGPFGPRR